MSDIQALLPKITFNTITADLFDTTANATARCIADTEKGHLNKPTQIRRFYDEVVMWNDKLKNKRDKYPEYIPFIKMLNAKVAYAQGRGHVDKHFQTLIAHCMQQVDNEKVETFFNFKLFMEAFMGFYKSHKH